MGPRIRGDDGKKKPFELRQSHLLRLMPDEMLLPTPDCSLLIPASRHATPLY